MRTYDELAPLPGTGPPQVLKQRRFWVVGWLGNELLLAVRWSRGYR